MKLSEQVTDDIQRTTVWHVPLVPLQMVADLTYVTAYIGVKVGVDVRSSGTSRNIRNGVLRFSNEIFTVGSK